MFFPFKRIKKQPLLGFTLIEILCVLLLVGFFLVASMKIYSNIIKSYVNSDQDYSQVQKCQIAIVRVMREMENASSVSTTNNIISYTYDGTRSIFLLDTNLVLYTSSDDANHILLDNVVAGSGFSANFTPIAGATSGSGLLNIQITTSFSNSLTKKYEEIIYVR